MLSPKFIIRSPDIGKEWFGKVSGMGLAHIQSQAPMGREQSSRASYLEWLCQKFQIKVAKMNVLPFQNYIQLIRMWNYSGFSYNVLGISTLWSLDFCLDEASMAVNDSHFYGSKSSNLIRHTLNIYNSSLLVFLSFWLIGPKGIHSIFLWEEKTTFKSETEEVNKGSMV